MLVNVVHSSKCDQVCKKLKKSLIENFIFCAVLGLQDVIIYQCLILKVFVKLFNLINCEFLSLIIICINSHGKIFNVIK